MSKLPVKRRIQHLLIAPVVKLLFFVIWSSCRVKVVGENNIDALIKSGKPFIPCYWHQHHFFCSWYMRQLIRRGVKIGFLISPSRDGEIPAKMARSWGGVVIRGSTTRTGAQALRDMYNIVVKDGVSPVTTSDGPQGPIHVFKIGDVLLSQFTQAPLLPLSYAANKSWVLTSWDQFIIPKPFSKIIVTIGQPESIPKGLMAEDLEPLRLQMENSLKALTQSAQDQVSDDIKAST
ncbi:MAG: lysophospholipid acyltransferase family protein [Gammaproteobacteria bacterium]|nr:lysophospholipid acyltransferase family protein [Gammaproteobacteria bacterium]MDH5778366.1 lysophospholipid acyltransferase family protein [Gammaproteobacteria bacterium]